MSIFSSSVIGRKITSNFIVVFIIRNRWRWGEIIRQNEWLENKKMRVIRCNSRAVYYSPRSDYDYIPARLRKYIYIYTLGRRAKKGHLQLRVLGLLAVIAPRNPVDHFPSGRGARLIRRLLAFGVKVPISTYSYYTSCRIITHWLIRFLSPHSFRGCFSN